MTDFTPTKPNRIVSNRGTMVTTITDRDPIIGWEAISTTAHPIRREMLLAERIWQVRDKAIDSGSFDFDELQDLADLATNLVMTDPCGCVLPDQSCKACVLAARANYILDIDISFRT